MRHGRVERPGDDSGTGSDGSRDASGDARSGNDSGNKDSGPGNDSSDLDSSVDDGSSDADDGSSADADDGSGIDSGLVCPVCKKGLACCTIKKSFNYGKCYNPACLACCM